MAFLCFHADVDFATVGSSHAGMSRATVSADTSKTRTATIIVSAGLREQDRGWLQVLEYGPKEEDDGPNRVPQTIATILSDLAPGLGAASRLVSSVEVCFAGRVQIQTTGPDQSTGSRELVGAARTLS